MNKISKDNKHIGLLLILVNGFLCQFIVFQAVYLSDVGYSESTIGVIMAVSSILYIISQPITGMLADSKLSMRIILIVYSLISVATYCLLPLTSKSLPLVFIQFMIMAVTFRAYSSMVDGYVVKLQQTKKHLDFGFVRGIGSFSFAIVAMISAYIIDRLGYNAMFFLYAAFGMATVCVLLTIKETHDKSIKKIDKSKASMKDAIVTMLKNKEFIVSLLGITIAFIGLSAHASYFGIIIKNMGGTRSDLGYATFIQAASETPVMMNFYRLKRRLSVERLLVFAMLIYSLRMFLMMITNNVITVILISGLQGLSFAIFLPSIILYVQSLAPLEIKTTALLFATAVFTGVGGILGSMSGGIIIEAYGKDIFYVCALAVSGFGTLIVGTNLYCRGKLAMRKNVS